MTQRSIYRTAIRQSVALLMLALAGAGVQAQPAKPAAAASAPAGPTIRAEIAAPLQAARDLITNKKGKEALPKLVEAEAIPGITPYENYVIARLRAVAAVDAEDYPVALAAFERSLASDFLPAADRAPLLDAAARLAIQLKDYPRAIGLLNRYKEAGGTEPALRRILPQVLAETGDHAAAVRESLVLVQADDAAGRGSPEALLRNLGYSQNKLNDAAGYLATMERLAQQYPKPDYFADLIGRVERKPGFNGERLRLDVYRLQRATGVELEPAELADMASRALQAGLPGEAQALMDEGYASGLLGKGKDATLHGQLRQQVQKAAAQDAKTLAESEKSAQGAKDGNALVNLGFAVSGMGQHDKAVALSTEGIAKGGLRRADEAQLHLGIAQWRAGKKDDALRSFAAVKGSDGSADLARVWTIYITGAKR